MTQPDVRLFDPAVVRDITPEVMGPEGRLRILPASYWAGTTVEERAVFGNRHGLYGLPTIELVEHLTELIGGRSALEIGAGSGVLAQALGIRATDSHQLAQPKYAKIYASARQPVAPYGPNVEKLNANRAVRRYRPQVVIGCWVTHIYDKRRHFAGGNVEGIDEPRLLELVDTYIHIGNEEVHKDKPIWPLPHTISYPDYVYSRAFNGTREFVASWPRTVPPPG